MHSPAWLPVLSAPGSAGGHLEPQQAQRLELEQGLRLEGLA